MSRCRSCNAEIIWAKTENGKMIPLDAEPDFALDIDAGLMVLQPVDGYMQARTLPRENGRLIGRRSHFATCPDAAEHRRAR